MEQEDRRGLFSKGLQSTCYELRGFRALFRIYLRRSSEQEKGEMLKGSSFHL